MVRVLSTVVPVLLLCCWCQLGCTKAVAPVAMRSVTIAVYVSDIHIPRSRRNTTECEDVFVEKNATTIKGEKQNVTVSSVQACKKFCLSLVRPSRTCTAVVYRYASGYCAYAVAYKTSTVTGNAASTTTYFKVAYRCPRYYLCSQFPCKNGATCKPVASEGVGVECVCAGGWKNWFCEEKAEDAGAEDTGDEDTGTEDTGAEDTGAEDTGAEDIGAEDTGAEDTGAEDTAAEDTGAEYIGAEDTGMSNTEKTVIAAAIIGVAGVTGVAATVVAVVRAGGATAATTAGTVTAVGYD